MGEGIAVIRWGRVVCCAVLGAAALAACSSDPSKTNRADVKACQDSTGIIKELNSIENDLAGGRALFSALLTDSAALARDAPSSLKVTAGNLNDAIAAMKPTIDRAKTLNQLQKASQTDTSFQDAVTDLVQAGEDLGTWKSAHCH